MGSSRTLVYSTAVVLVLLSSATTDEQHDVTLDFEFMQEIQKPDLSGMQRPLGYFLDEGLPDFKPRSFSGPPVLDYPVKFPLGRPTSKNLQAICLDGDHRPRYPDSYFPKSGFGQQRRKASAVNKAESWFSTCCKRNQTWERDVVLCCATQAWELSVESFCEEDSSVKDRLYSCCSLRGSDRLNCFHNSAPNPNYEPTEILPVPPLPFTANFNFDPNTCQSRTVPKKVDITFPPGRPTADTIESLCGNQKLRPLYTVKCLPGLDYEWLAHQAKAINRIEKAFKQCCRKKQGVLNCADQKWREELNKFCLGENGKEEDFHCCKGGGGNERYNCFQNASPDPHYNMTSANEELSLPKICNTHKMIKNKFPVGFPLKSFVNQCCLPISEQDKSLCFAQKLEEISGSLCLKRKSPPAVHHCCHMPSQEAPQCISKILMDAITKATKVLRHNKKKKCPYA
ncbi:extracellular matrix protein 1-like isoform X1 [Micropterus salmoides]|uniref:extracellular matrix protein 1-like isoform X1 n=1 Tax=Micropterus salmoides TaxID=27706 RepID=UPI0018EBCA75|nr:extracellular matrix protein 1-like isoform X1 [Micropterus salmoides]